MNNNELKPQQNDSELLYNIIRDAIDNTELTYFEIFGIIELIKFELLEEIKFLTENQNNFDDLNNDI